MGRHLHVVIEVDDGILRTTAQHTISSDLLYERIQELLNNQLRQLTNKLEHQLKKARQGQSINKEQ